MVKGTFIIRTEWFDAINELDPVDQATIFQNLFYFHLDNENLINLNNLSVKLVWKMIEPNLKRNIASYDRRCDTSAENGAKGGRPRKNQEVTEKENNLNNLTQKPIETKKPIETLNDSDSVSDSVPVSDSENESTGTKKFVPPSIDEVADYFFSISTDKKLGYEYSKIFAEKFIGHYTLTNWKYGKAKVPIKNWKLALTNSWNVDQWINEQEQKKNNGNTYKRPEKTGRLTGRVEPPPHGTPFGQL